MASPIYGTAFLKLKPDLDGFGREVESQLGRSTRGLSGAGKKVGLAVGGAAVTGVGAAFAGGLKGVIDFSSFERSMNEVFTLLPGISQQAMDTMSEQVKGFSKDFAVLPEQVVPALYQSLSAGVPPDNVFEFLETAQKAALGGVTDLTTAVDGISSVVNAYGSDVLDAAQASDLMFTAVRLGKTNFEELSNSLFQVIPTASALGVEFGDVTAALATMTAQGVPTSVATTQLRQLFVELSKAGGQAATAFEEIAGKSFQDFISEGGNVADALVIMEEAAATSGVSLQDMFGSVEAGAAALSLTSSDSFVNNLDEMAGAAGATDAAYEQMDQGLARTWERIKATFSVAFVDIGDRLAPFVQKFGDAFAEKLPGAVETFFDFIDRIAPSVTAAFGFISDAVGQISNLFSAFTDEGAAGAAEVLDNMFGNTGDLIGPFTTVIETAQEILGDLWTFIRDAIIPVVSDLGETFQNILPFAITPLGLIRDLLGFIADNADTLRPLIAGLITGFLAFKTVTTVIGIAQGAMAAFNLVMAANPIGLVVAAIAALVAGVIYAYNNFETFRNIVDGLWDAIVTGVGAAVDFVQSAWEAIVGFLSGVWGTITGGAESAGETFTGIWETVTGVLSDIWDTISGIVSTAMDLIRGVIDVVMGVITGDWERAWDGVKSIFSTAITAVRTVASDRLDQVAGFFRDLPGRLLRLLSRLPDMLFGLGADMIAGLIGGFGNIATRVYNSIKDGVTSAIDRAKEFFGISSPSRFFAREIGAPLGDGILLGVSDSIAALGDLMTDELRDAQRKAVDSLEPIDLGLADTAAVDRIRSRAAALADPVTGGGFSVGDITVYGGDGDTTEESIRSTLLSVALNPYMRRVSGGSSI